MIGKEKHGSNNSLRDVILGGQDGLVNMLGIALGVVAAGGSTHVLIVTGIAAAITESIFSWPGLGLLAVQSVTTNDFPVVLAIVMIGGMMVLLGNLLADVLYGFVDPRIKY